MNHVHCLDEKLNQNALFLNFLDLKYTPVFTVVIKININGGAHLKESIVSWNLEKEIIN
jgi:hypothetical protein